MIHGDAGAYQPVLQCVVRQLTYDFESRVGHVYMADGNSTDMSGAVALFSVVDYHVRRITTYTGTGPEIEIDTVYNRLPDGDWIAETHRGTHPISD